MLYLIGGAARSGKTLLAQRLFRERGVPYFCVDYFVSALDQAAPELGIVAESPNESRSKLLWPRMVPMLRNIVEVEPYYTVEGDALLPSGVASLAEEYKGAIRPCFLGFARSIPQLKLEEIRKFSGGINDWIQDHDDAYILDLCTEMIDFSRYVQRECSLYELPYFDVSDHFTEVLEKAYQSLIA